MATDKTTYWLDIADYDLDTAEALHKTAADSTSPSCAIRSSRRRSKPTGALPVTTTRPTRTTTSGWPTAADSTSN